MQHLRVRDSSPQAAFNRVAAFEQLASAINYGASVGTRAVIGGEPAIGASLPLTGLFVPTTTADPGPTQTPIAPTTPGATAEPAVSASPAPMANPAQVDKPMATTSNPPPADPRNPDSQAPSADEHPSPASPTETQSSQAPRSQNLTSPSSSPALPVETPAQKPFAPPPESSNQIHAGSFSVSTTWGPGPGADVLPSSAGASPSSTLGFTGNAATSTASIVQTSLVVSSAAGSTSTISGTNVISSIFAAGASATNSGISTMSVTPFTDSPSQAPHPTAALSKGPVIFGIALSAIIALGLIGAASACLIRSSKRNRAVRRFLCCCCSRNDDGDEEEGMEHFFRGTLHAPREEEQPDLEKAFMHNSIIPGPPPPPQPPMTLPRTEPVHQIRSFAVAPPAHPQTTMLPAASRASSINEEPLRRKETLCVANLMPGDVQSEGTSAQTTQQSVFEVPRVDAQSKIKNLRNWQRRALRLRTSFKKADDSGSLNHLPLPATTGSNTATWGGNIGKSVASAWASALSAVRPTAQSSAYHERDDKLTPMPPRQFRSEISPAWVSFARPVELEHNRFSRDSCAGSIDFNNFAHGLGITLPSKVESEHTPLPSPTESEGERAATSLERALGPGEEEEPHFPSYATFPARMCDEVGLGRSRSGGSDAGLSPQQERVTFARGAMKDRRAFSGSSI